MTRPVKWSFLVQVTKSSDRDAVIRQFACMELEPEQVEWLERKVPGFTEEAKKIRFERYKNSSTYRLEQRIKDKVERESGSYK